MFHSNVLLCMVVIIALTLSAGQRVAAHRHVVDFEFTSPQVTAELNRLITEVNAKFDVWKVLSNSNGGNNNNSSNIHLRASVTEREEAELLSLLSSNIRPHTRSKRAFASQETATGQEKYSNMDDILKRMSALEKTYPHIAKNYVIGITQQSKKPIAAIKISVSPDKNDDAKPEIVLVGTHHAREWISTEAAIGTAEMICRTFSTSPIVQSVLDRLEIWVIPVLNEDGFRYTFEAGSDAGTQDRKRYWRKNMRGNVGVDLNRNYDNNFGGPGSSSLAYDETYRGTYAFSELETQALRDFVGYPSKSIKPLNGYVDDVRGMISLHSYGQLLLYPLGGSRSKVANNVWYTEFLGFVQGAISNTTGYSYRVEQASALYVAAGDACDWFSVEHSLKPAFTIELRPDDRACCAFELPGDQIEGCVHESMISTMFLAEYVSSQPKNLSWATHAFDHALAGAWMDRDRDTKNDYIQPWASPTAFLSPSRTVDFEVSITDVTMATSTVTEYAVLDIASCLGIDARRIWLVESPPQALPNTLTMYISMTGDDSSPILTMNIFRALLLNQTFSKDSVAYPSKRQLLEYLITTPNATSDCTHAGRYQYYFGFSASSLTPAPSVQGTPAVTTASNAPASVKIGKQHILVGLLLLMGVVFLVV